MARVVVRTPEKAVAGPMPPGFSGTAKSLVYLEGEAFPLGLRRYDVGQTDTLEIGPLPADCLGYVLKGEVRAGDQQLDAGSVIIAERGTQVSVSGGGEAAQLLVFTSAKPLEKPSAGGHVHLLPAGTAPCMDDIGMGIGGTMFADSQCPTCDVWLHENRWPATDAQTGEPLQSGLHSHTEDEIIFITDGAMKLGNQTVGPGTAVAIAADTVYTFTVGEEGLKFVNFRAEMPEDIQFPDREPMSETGFWKERLPGPEYLNLT